MQPAFLPWQGLFELILRSDRFVFLDDFQYVVQSHHTRNKLFVNKGQVGYYQVPVCKAACFEKPLNQTLIVGGNAWRRKICRRLQQVYGSAPYFGEVFPQVEAWLGAEHESLAALNMAGIRMLCRLLGIDTPLLYSSDYTRETRSASARTRRVAELLDWAGATLYLSAFGSFDYMEADGYDARKRPVLFQHFCPQEYSQPQSEEGFIPYLSVLDALLNVGPAATRSLVEQGTRTWLSYEERRSLRG